MMRRPPTSKLFPYTTLFRSKTKTSPGKEVNLTAVVAPDAKAAAQYYPAGYWFSLLRPPAKSEFPGTGPTGNGIRSEEHTSELQSHSDLVCRLLLEKKKNHNH